MMDEVLNFLLNSDNKAEATFLCRGIALKHWYNKKNYQGQPVITHTLNISEEKRQELDEIFTVFKLNRDSSNKPNFFKYTQIAVEDRHRDTIEKQVIKKFNIDESELDILLLVMGFASVSSLGKTVVSNGSDIDKKRADYTEAKKRLQQCPSDSPEYDKLQQSFNKLKSEIGTLNKYPNDFLHLETNWQTLNQMKRLWDLLQEYLPSNPNHEELKPKYSIEEVEITLRDNETNQLLPLTIPKAQQWNCHFFDHLFWDFKDKHPDIEVYLYEQYSRILPHHSDIEAHYAFCQQFVSYFKKVYSTLSDRSLTEIFIVIYKCAGYEIQSRDEVDAVRQWLKKPISKHNATIENSIDRNNQLVERTKMRRLSEEIDFITIKDNRPLDNSINH